MPKANTDSLWKAPPENILNMPNMVPSACAKKEDSATLSMPGTGNVYTDAIDNQKTQGENDSFFEFGYLEYVLEPAADHYITSTLPPTASIFSLALLLI